MTRTYSRSFAARGVAGSLFLVLLPVLFLATGCSDDNPLPVCENCEDWTQITEGLGRSPDPHPLATNDAFIAFSTIRKEPNAPDGDQEADEDIWLAWVLDRTDPSQNVYYQLTFDDLGPGDNFSPRWSPDGTRLAFVHTSAAGGYEIWQMSVTLPAGPSDPPVLGVPSLVVVDGRDPVWSSPGTLLFSRDDKLYGVLASGGAEFQITYDPPGYTSSDDYVDRHPDVSADGAIIFNTMGRVNVADVFVEAFEIDPSGPDTVAVSLEDGRGAWIQFQAPGSPLPSYPITSSGDTLRTPTLLRSIPVDAGGTFRIGARLDTRGIEEEDSTSLGILTSAYCDTTIVGTWNAAPNSADTVRAYFQVTRGTLEVSSGVTGTEVAWRRADLRESNTSPNYAHLPTEISSGGDAIAYECLFVHAVTPGGEALLDSLSTFIVTGQTDDSMTDTVVVRDLRPGETRRVGLFPTGKITGTLLFDDNPQSAPQTVVTALDPNSGEPVVEGGFNPGTSAFEVRGLLEGTYDILFEAGDFYFDSLLTGIEILADPADSEAVLDTDVGDVVITSVPTGSISGTIVHSDSPANPPGISIEVFTTDTNDLVGATIADENDGTFLVSRLLTGSYDLVITSLGYSNLELFDVTVTAPNDTDIGLRSMIPGTFVSPIRARHELAATFERPSRPRALPEPAAPRIWRSGPPRDTGSAGAQTSILRAPGDVATLWRISVAAGGEPILTEILGSPFMLQSPALTPNLAGSGDLRYLAYVTNEPGNWELRIQRLRDWQADGSPYVVPTPGSFDNLACTRSVISPRWGSTTRPGELRLYVALTDCPDNAFEDLDFDEQPWAQGELRVWEVLVTDY